ncbi:MAG: c-type cytochrome [Verrucomicrobiae bacterium]|nr:c-type cytochrome [Verrucomicrobiae bacterium]
MNRTLLLALGLAAGSFGSALAAETPDAKTLRTKALELLAPLPDRMPGSENDTPERVALGQKLFFEKRLSLNQSQSCNTCHRVDEGKGGVDNEPTSPGAKGERGGRNSPTVLNAGFHVAQFWDGRAETLEDQAKGPVLNPIEMAMPAPEVVLERLNADAGYAAAFKKAFPGEATPVSYDNFARAVAAFERTLITRDRFDDFLKGDDSALTLNERAGLNEFLTIGCTTCHYGPLLGGNNYKKIGIVNVYENDADKGRIEVTKEEYDELVFKVPSLRNIALTWPYFHDGRQATLRDAVKSMAWLQLGLELDATQLDRLVAFLQTLTDKPRVAAK